MKRVVLFGPPGVGKGTQGGRLAATLGVPVISTGDLFRAHVRNGTDLGKRLSALIAAGDYVPDSVTNTMLAERLAEPDAQGGFLLDGYPRTADQVAELDRLLALSDTSLDAVLLLSASDDVLEERLLKRAAEQGRSDDTPEVIRHRLALYHAETEPLVALYDAADLVLRVDGVGTTDEVHERLIAAIGQVEPSALP
ncbi:adenylate kinase [Amnibacterium kyonggiense]|uniref:Adenylate kinase n=1 Tax=Amnibacterium kyonggiense TaxID=595671 RepID=A0A4R7FPJ3_9MICO|nr:adenylate kinase [Amnibacterium kyonggiense]TDS79677.1 adenylate kinase [Amnibacterium kyonggiense]